MPSANLDLVRSIYADWERGDYTATEWAHPDIEYVIADGPSPGRWKGLTGMADAWRDWLSAWEGYHVEAEGYRELDPERVLVFTLYTGRGKTSGIQLAQMRSGGAILFHVRGGKVTKFIGYWDRDRALGDLGLAPEESRDPR